MAMTKAERAEMEKLRKDLALALALRWSGLVEPARLSIPSGDKYINGWQFGAYSKTVSAAWTGVVSHGTGHLVNGAKDRPGSQGAAHLFATKKDAAIGLRLAVERECAEVLARIDVMIAEAS